MKYGITQLVSGHSEFFKISKKSYDEVAYSISSLYECLYIEQNYDILVENYLDFVKSNLSSTAYYMMHWNVDYFWFQTERLKAIRRLFNLLSTCRLYIYQTKICLSNIFKDNDTIKNTFVQFTKENYENNLCYMFMEQLRNCIQHRQSPIGISFSSKRIEKEDNFKISCSLSTFLNIEKIEKDKDFNIKIREGIRQLNIDKKFTDIVKEYIEIYSQTHENLRGLLKEDIDNWDKIICEIVDYYKDKTSYDDPMVGLSIGIKNDDGTISNPHHINLESSEYRKKLVKRNRLLHNLPALIISDEK